jgi:hypothetical protein
MVSRRCERMAALLAALSDPSWTPMLALAPLLGPD